MPGRLPVFRSRVLPTPRLGSAMSAALDVDALRRRDALELEQIFGRYRAQLGTAADAPDTIGERLDRLEALLALAQPIAFFAGAATASVNVTLFDAINLSVVGVSGSGIDYVFADPSPDTNYALSFSGQTLTQGVQHIVQNKTRTGFRLAYRQANGITSDPLVSAFAFAFFVHSRGAST